jgi:hypothetical protein
VTTPIKPEVHAQAPFENCRICQRATHYWTDIPDRTPGEQVALCVDCAYATFPSDIPTKSDWCAAERARHPRYTHGA